MSSTEGMIKASIAKTLEHTRFQPDACAVLANAGAEFENRLRTDSLDNPVEQERLVVLDGTECILGIIVEPL